MRQALLLIAAFCGLAWAEPAPGDPAYPIRERAYNALREKDYDTAIAEFQQAILIDPANPAVRKDLAYTFLKVGENESARDQFGAVRELAPSDHRASLEYAFLCFETGREREARSVFDSVRRTGDAETRVTAERAFLRIDGDLADGITRWLEAIERDPGNFSAHRELARLAERRDALELALRNYLDAWKLRPSERGLLIDYARMAAEAGREEEAMAALLAASRCGTPRVSEQARERLPARYPYGSEFVRALDLDPANVALRREYAYLLLEMKNEAEAEQQFSLMVAQAPDDLLAVAQLGFLLLNREDYQAAIPLLHRVLDSGDPELARRVRQALNLPEEAAGSADVPEQPTGGADDARGMAMRSLDAGYLQDAMKFLQIAHRQDPADFEVMLGLGKTHNMLRQDSEAIRWFDLARRSPDPGIAAEAETAYRNLSPSHQRFRHTFWIMPFYSSRWEDAFGYAQFKTEVRLQRLPILPYVSVRFAGDARRTIGSVAPQYLSESSFIFGVGVRTVSWKGLLAWAEVGSDVSYLDRNDRAGRMAPDYRGGASFGRFFGSGLGGESTGPFLETNLSGVFMSRFDHTLLGYSQNRLGYTAPVIEVLGGLESQLHWNGNLTVDAKRQEWANFTEFGPGVRFRWKWMPAAMVFSVDFLRGVYLLDNSPRGPNYNDLRAGVWYAFTK